MEAKESNKYPKLKPSYLLPLPEERVKIHPFWKQFKDAGDGIKKAGFISRNPELILDMVLTSFKHCPGIIKKVEEHGYILKKESEIRIIETRISTYRASKYLLEQEINFLIKKFEDTLNEKST